MSNAILEQNDGQIDSSDLWSVAQGEKNGEPLFIRFRSERPQGVEPAAYPFLLSATWSYQGNEHGLPTTEEMERMDRFEDALSSAFERSQTAHLMVVLTSAGERDWLWYTRGEEEAMSLVNQALRGHKAYPVEFSVQKDRAWRAYAQFEPGDAAQPSSGNSLIGWAIAKTFQFFGR